jgi:aspartate kinase
MRIVQKFGGTSVGGIDRIKNVALKVQKEVAAGHEVAVVVSAMAGVTNQLVDWVSQLSPLNSPEACMEYDQVVATGEQVTAGLLALALQEMGIPARSFSGWQVPVITDSAHSKARISSIDPKNMETAMAAKQVVIVTGFQGKTQDGRISTLGRGGSDTSAVALAASLKADRCDIYTDVDGVYTSDPRIVSGARKLERISYEEMLEMASLGAKVLQTRSVEMAMRHNVVVQVLSSFNDEPGTLLVKEEEVVEQKLVTGIAFARDEARITLTKIANIPGMSAALFGPLAEAGINVDMIVQNVTEAGTDTDITFTVPKADLDRALATVEKARTKLKYASIHADRNVAKVSIIGVGMRSHAGIAQTMFAALADKNINISVISTSEIKVSVLIAEEYTELAVRTLHTAFGLDKAA